MAFGHIRITYRELLDNLRRRADCQFHHLAGQGDIPDTDESASGELILVVRGERFALIEVYHERLPVLPDVLRSICVQLDLDEDDVCGRTH